MNPTGRRNFVANATHLFSVAAGVPPAVEPGILPGGLSCGLRGHFRVQSCHSGRRDAALYGSKDGCRYRRKTRLNTYTAAIIRTDSARALNRAGKAPALPARRIAQGGT